MILDPGSFMKRSAGVMVGLLLAGLLRGRLLLLGALCTRLCARLGGGLVPVEDIDLPDTTPGADVNILARDVLNRVNALPEAQRQSVFLVYVEGFSYKEAAEIMEIPIGTVMSRLAGARKRLNSDMADVEVEAK